MNKDVQTYHIGIRQRSFEFIFIFYLIMAILSNTFFALYIPSYSVIAIISFGLLFFREISVNKFRVKTIVQIVLVGCFVILILASGNMQLTNPLVSLIIFSLCARDLDYQRILKLSFKVILSILLIVIISSQIGLITDYISVFEDRTRHFLGFLYALYPGALVFELMLIAIYLDKSFCCKLLLVILNFVIFGLTSGRLSFGLTLIAIFLCSETSVKVLRKISSYKSIKFILASVYIGFAVISLYLSLIYTESITWLYELNRLLSYRLNLTQRALSMYGISLMGKKVSFTGGAVNAHGVNVNAGMEYLTVDNGYIDILIKYGIIAMIVYLAILTYLLYILLKTENYKLYLIFFVIGIHLLIDFSMLNLIYNVFMLVTFYRADVLIRLRDASLKKKRPRIKLVLSRKKV